MEKFEVTQIGNTLFRLVPIATVTTNMTPSVSNESFYKAHKGRKNNKYSSEALDYVKANKSSMTMKELAKELNKKFGMHTDETKLGKTLYNYDIK